MPVKNRVRVSACYNDFKNEITRLKKFDNLNHKKFSLGQLSKAQIALMVESIFFAGFRTYEGFVREIFVLYCMGKPTPSMKTVKSYLKPKSFEHSELLIKSSMTFLDWNSPELLISRSELYLENGFPIKLPYTTNLQILRDFKKLRNHIAHNSNETETQFEKVVRTYYGGVKPLKLPTPGQYLMLPSKTKPANYLLLDFFDFMEKISLDMT